MGDGDTAARLQALASHQTPLLNLPRLVSPGPRRRADRVTNHPQLDLSPSLAGRIGAGRGRPGQIRPYMLPRDRGCRPSAAS
jgi:hypothetical protein